MRVKKESPSRRAEPRRGISKVNRGNAEGNSASHAGRQGLRVGIERRRNVAPGAANAEATPRAIRWADLDYDERLAWGAMTENLVSQRQLPAWGAELLESIRLRGVDDDLDDATISAVDELLGRAAAMLGVVRA